MNVRPPAGGDVAQHLFGLLVAFLVDREHGGVVVKRPRGDDP